MSGLKRFNIRYMEPGGYLPTDTIVLAHCSWCASDRFKATNRDCKVLGVTPA